MKTFNMIKNHFENFSNYIRERLSTAVFLPIGVLCISGSQHIMGNVLPCSVILRSIFFAAFNVSFNNFLLRLLCLWIYWCWIFIFIWENFCWQFGNVAFSMVTTTNFSWSSSRSFLTYWSLSTGFVCLGLIFCLSCYFFSPLLILSLSMV